MIKGETLLLPVWGLQVLWSASSESAHPRALKPHTNTNVPAKQFAEASQHSSGICPHIQKKLNELL